jgi:tRNA threonylcarbamoyladenosine biosynthesis protein TsaB
MRILAVDTTAHFGSLALSEDGAVVDEVVLHSPEGFSQTLFEHIARLMQRRGIGTCDIDCFAAAAGPGSFTGVRVGLAAVKGLAEASGRQAIGVSNLKALAACSSAAVRAAVIDARRGEIYGAVYDASLHTLVDETTTKFSDWLASVPAGEVEFISPDFAPFRSALAATMLRDASVIEVRALAGSIARTAAAELAAGASGDPALLDANYVRRSDAELYWKEQ